MATESQTPRACSPLTCRAKTPESTRGRATVGTTALLQIGEEEAEVHLTILADIEPGSMLLPLLSSRWGAGIDDSDGLPRQLELDATVETWAVLLLIRSYARTGVLRRAEVEGKDTRALLRAALYLGFSRLVPMVPDAPNALAWTEFVRICELHSHHSLAGINLVCKGGSLADTELKGIDLSGAAFTGAALSAHTCTDWSEAKLQGTSFSFASINSASLALGLRAKSVPPALSQYWYPYALTTPPTYPSDLRTLKLTRADLSGASFFGACICACDFSQACLQGTSHTGAVISTCCFANANLRECNLSGAELRCCELSEAQLIRSKFVGATLTYCDFTGADLQDCDFRGASLQSCIFSKANLQGCDFGGATFTPGPRPEKEDGRLREIIPVFQSYEFILATLRNTQFTGCTFKSTPSGPGMLFFDLDPSSDLRSCGFRDCVFSGDLSGGYASPSESGAKLCRWSSTFSEPTSESERVDDESAFKPSCDLMLRHSDKQIVFLQVAKEAMSIGWPNGRRQQNLDAKAVRRLDLSGCDLTGSRFDNCLLYNVDLSNASLQGCSFCGADLRMASLRGADASGVNFCRADLSFTNLDGANLAGANLREASFWCLTGFSGQVIDGTVEPTHVDGVPTGASALLSASRTQAVFRTHWQDARFKKQHGNNLVANATCEGTNFSGASLHAADMRGISLRNANMRKAMLCFASLEGADVTGTQLDGAEGPFVAGHADSGE